MIKLASYKSPNPSESSDSNSSTSSSRGGQLITFHERPDLTRNSQNLSESIVNGSWGFERDLGRGKKKHFVPASIDDAKSLLRQSASDVLKINKSKKMSRTLICHGCHTVLGEGAHQGSAIGKARCVMPHSLLCKGNYSRIRVMESLPCGLCF